METIPLELLKLPVLSIKQPWFVGPAAIVITK
ncbi:hypothetical protein OpiT1DRAFT_03880 [Opitutaceae bacterium TAV1]|nr:hypothetical protein OpiT1DRAFT_03880 [Opitutaceae bacterium TAV1]